MTEVLEQPVVDRFVGTASIAKILDLSITHVRHRLTKRDDFPKPIWIGGAQRWRLSEVMKWVEQR